MSFETSGRVPQLERDRARSRKRRIALIRWVISLTAALLPSCTCQRGAPPSPPREIAPGAADAPHASPLLDQAPTFSIALLPMKPLEKDVKAAVAELLPAQFPNLRVQSPSQSIGSLPVVIVGSYHSPGLGPEVLDAEGRDFSPETRAALAKPLEATALEFHVAPGDALASLRRAQDLAGTLAQKVDAVLVDAETHELYDPGRWKLFRVGGWNGDLPAITSQLVLRRNGGTDQAPRLVTFGMAKFGLPDVAATERADAAGPPLSGRLHLLCQLLVEGMAPGPDGRMTLETSRIRESTMKRALAAAPITGPFHVRLKQGTPQAGDPDNRIFDLEAASADQ